ncbi:AAA family ATPase [Emcibacter sp. SYSU 3D8]|uniref:AAA family ATPase n=1 Tax=Emcibacter sp. SYSU 3D8 TaxID=3133969 RepID=UPI0031FF2141
MTSEATYRPELVETATDRLVIISGCSGGGKSTLLAELARRGHAVRQEAGRQVVKEQLFIGGTGLPWADIDKFIELTVSRTMHNMISASQTGKLTFFDRGIVDQIAGSGQVPNHLMTAAHRFRCYRRVFFAPPWRDIYQCDAERRHGFEDAVAAYGPLRIAYEALGYDVVELPKTDVGARAAFVLQRLILE